MAVETSKALELKTYSSSMTNTAIELRKWQIYLELQLLDTTRLKHISRLTVATNLYCTLIGRLNYTPYAH